MGAEVANDSTVGSPNSEEAAARALPVLIRTRVAPDMGLGSVTQRSCVGDLVHECLVSSGAGGQQLGPHSHIAKEAPARPQSHQSSPSREGGTKPQPRTTISVPPS